MIYRSFLRLRHHAYDKGWLISHRAPICTASVGNIAVGGSGKTPIVQALAKAMSMKCKVAISLRGYLGAAEHFDEPIAVTSQTDPALCGDEALIHATNLSDVLIYAGKSRLRAGHMAARQGADLLILDDGMQHRRLQRDVEIAVIDAQDDLRTQRLLPFGRLRDLPERLRCADVVFLHNAWEELPNLGEFTDAPVIATRMVASPETQAVLRGKEIAYFCGVGRPQRFEEMLLSLGAKIVAKQHLSDHVAITPRQFTRLAKRGKAEGAEVFVCTQKDFVKLPRGFECLEIPIHVVQAEAVVVRGREAWEQLLASIVQKIQQRKRDEQDHPSDSS